MKLLLRLLLIIIVSEVNLQGQGLPYTLEEAQATIAKISDPQKICDTSLVMANKFFMYMKREESEKILKNAIEVARDHNLKDKLVPLLMDMARCQEQIGTLKDAIDISREALSLLDEETANYEGKLYNYLGRYFQKNDQLDSMLYYYTKTEEWNNENEPYRNWILYEQWHQKYIEIGDLEKAEEFLLKSYAITKPVAHPMDHGMLLYRLRQLSSRKGDMAKLAQYSKEYYDLTKKKEKRNGSFVHGLDLAEGLTRKEQIAQFETLLEENKKIAFAESDINVYIRLSALYLADNNPKAALRYATKIDTTDTNLTFKSDYLDNKFEAYEMLGNSTMALSILKQKIAIDQQKKQAVKASEIRNLEKKYETQQKESEIATLKAQDALKSFQLEQAEKHNLIYGSLALFLLFLLSALAYLFIQNKKNNQLLTEKNEIIRKALKDKDVLLREIHHRVKNNLQVISSLLNLQSNYISDDIALQAINEGKNRVTSMALIHQNLYQEENLTAINSRVYFEDLIESIFDSYNIGDHDLTLHKKVADINLDVETMVPLGLIVNELISNVLKHAFTKDHKNGSITFSLDVVNDELIMSIADNGKGFDKSEFFNSKSFGNKLIMAFQKKLKAEIEVESDKGSSVTLRIKNYKTVA